MRPTRRDEEEDRGTSTELTFPPLPSFPSPSLYKTLRPPRHHQSRTHFSRSTRLVSPLLPPFTSPFAFLTHPDSLLRSLHRPSPGSHLGKSEAPTSSLAPPSDSGGVVPELRPTLIDLLALDSWKMQGWEEEEEEEGSTRLVDLSVSSTLTPTFSSLLPRRKEKLTIFCSLGFTHAQLLEVNVKLREQDRSAFCGRRRDTCELARRSFLFSLLSFAFFFS